ncbi:MAG TPA: biotin/lipoyl-containing protein, partial [Myxococcota bacterium]|nr:biotin/lipoyl-containing protein [Myxococcota bacterium]
TKKLDRAPTRAECLAYLLYPKVYLDFLESRERHGTHVSSLPTTAFFHGMGLAQEIHVEIERGQGLVIRLVAIGDPDAEGKRAIFFDLNGQPRRITVHDRTLGIQIEKRAKADPEDPRHVGAPLPGLLASHAHSEGASVRAGERLCVIEAMKMESNVTAPLGARIQKIHVPAGEHVESGDLLFTLDPT